MTRLTLDQVDHVALLARLTLSAEEREQLASDLTVMLEHFETLQRIDTTNVEPMTHAMSLVNVWREDVTGPSLPREELLAQGPDAREEFFVVPRVVED